MNGTEPNTAANPTRKEGTMTQAQATRQAGPFRVYYTNLFYSDPREFGSVEEAIEHGKAGGFGFVVQRAENGSVLYGWDIIGGGRWRA